jgi:hypothetical protein
MTLDEWAERHQMMGHHPHSAPTKENPERCDSECGCIWRILTPEQIRMEFAHLKHRPRSTNPDHLVPGVPSPTDVPTLRIAERYAARTRRTPR